MPTREQTDRFNGGDEELKYRAERARALLEQAGQNAGKPFSPKSKARMQDVLGDWRYSKSEAERLVNWRDLPAEAAGSGAQADADLEPETQRQPKQKPSKSVGVITEELEK